MVSSRARCPYYGFCWPEGTSLFETGDDQCALNWWEGVPKHCAMKTQGRYPDMHVCPVANDLRYVLDPANIITFYPKEHPDGVSFAEWTGEVCPGCERDAA